MKYTTIIILALLAFLTSCQITDLEVSVSNADFDGVYLCDVDCDGRFEDTYRGRIEVSITNTFGTSYEVVLNGRDRLLGRSVGSRLILEDQTIRSISTSNKLNLNGEISESSFDDLVFEFSTSLNGQQEQECSLDLKGDF